MGMKTYAAAAALGTAAAVGIAAPGAGTTRLDLFVHDTSQVVTDLGRSGPSTGDLFSFHGQVFTHKGGPQVGRFGGTCTTLGAGRDLSCSASFRLREGQLIVQGVFPAARFYSGRTVALAVLGGTGAYAGAGGEGTVRIPNGDKDSTDGIVTLTLR